MCLAMSLKYFFASAEVLVPSPCERQIDESATRFSFTYSRAGRRTDLEVLDVPSFSIVVLLSPGLVLGKSVEGLLRLRLGGLEEVANEKEEGDDQLNVSSSRDGRQDREEANLDDRSDELDEEPRNLEERREEVVEEVDEQTIDVRSILILRDEQAIEE